MVARQSRPWVRYISALIGVIVAASLLAGSYYWTRHSSAFKSRVERSTGKRPVWTPPEEEKEADATAEDHPLPPSPTAAKDPPPKPVTSPNWTFNTALLSQLGREVYLPSSELFVFRPPANYRYKPLKDGDAEWLSAARDDRSYHHIYVSSSMHGEHFNYDQKGLKQFADNWLSGFQGFDELNQTDPEQGTINGLNAARFYYSGLMGINRTPVRGVVYLVLDGPSAIICSGWDQAPYDRDTIALTDVVACTIRKTSPPIGVTEGTLVSLKDAAAEPRPWVLDEARLDLAEREPIPILPHYTVRVPHGFEQIATQQGSRGVRTSGMAWGFRAEGRPAAMLNIATTLARGRPSFAGLSADAPQPEAIADDWIRLSASNLANLERTAPERGQVDGMLTARSYWIGEVPQVGLKVRGLVYVLVDGVTIVVVSGMASGPEAESVLQLIDASALSFQKNR